MYVVHTYPYVSYSSIIMYVRYCAYQAGTGMQSNQSSYKQKRTGILGVANYYFVWLYRCTGTIVQETKIANKKAYNWKVIDDPCINLKYDCTIVLVPLYLVQIIQEYR